MIESYKKLGIKQNFTIISIISKDYKKILWKCKYNHTFMNRGDNIDQVECPYCNCQKKNLNNYLTSFIHANADGSLETLHKINKEIMDIIYNAKAELETKSKIESKVESKIESKVESKIEQEKNMDDLILANCQNGHEILVRNKDYINGQVICNICEIVDII
jgi:hypothetical protein